MPKLGVRCVPLKDDASVSAASPKGVAQEQDGEDLPKLVAAAPSASVEALAPLAAVPRRLQLPPVNRRLRLICNKIQLFQIARELCWTAHFRCRRMRKQIDTQRRAYGGRKLISCEPQKVSIRSGLMSGTFLSSRVLKIELIP